MHALIGQLKVVVIGAAAAGAAFEENLGRLAARNRGRDLFEPLDLAIGRCRMIVAERVEPRDPAPAAPVASGLGGFGGHSAWDEAADRAQAHLRIATKYPRTTRAYLQRKGITAEVIKLKTSWLRPPGDSFSIWRQRAISE